MRPTKASIYELFERQRRFVVLLFQRAYVWREDPQWERLWDDIQDKAEDDLAERSFRPHYLGAIVLSQSRRYGFEVDASDIIDGQQRLTTLQVLLAALRGVVETTDLNDLKVDLARVTENSGTKAHDFEKVKV
jgi:uncharacterized protein with ParB-like and HNH nuclease domain